MKARAPSRREFLQVSAAAGGAFVVALALPSCAHRSGPAERAQRGEFVPNAWLRILPSGEIIFVLDRVEMGQGTMTSHAALVAEELEVDPASIRVELAPADRAYDNPDLGFQITGGSTSVKTSFVPLRKAGAVAREMLKAAAAARWGVAAAECEAHEGAIHHRPSARTLPYGALALAAAHVPVPDPPLKPPSQFRVIGRSIPRLDSRAKVEGSAVYGIDVEVAGLLTAVVVRAPVRGGTVRKYDAAAALASPGVVAAVQIPTGIAVVARTYFEARTASERVAVEWNPGPLAGLSSADLRARLERRARQSADTVRSRGRFTEAFRAAKTRVEAIYEVPYLAHAPMEPMNATAHVSRDRCEIWAPTQSPALARVLAARATGLDPSAVAVHTTFLGGGFGRRIPQDYVIEAVEVARRVGKPVKVIWSREDDLANDFYRPMTFNVLKGGLDEHGNLSAWFHRIVGQSVVAHVAPDFVQAMAPERLPGVMARAMGRSAARMYRVGTLIDETSIEGAHDLPYEVPHLLVEYAVEETGVPVGFWRSVGHSENGFIVESFIDELAHVAGQDPYRFRRQLLAKTPRQRAVLDLAAAKAGWGSQPPSGVFRGIAQHASFDSVCAQVAEVSVQGQKLRVHRVVCAIDCGRVINPDLVRAQLEGAVIFGLSAALKQAITFKDGRVVETNFDRFPLLRMHEAPHIEVHFVESEAAPTGVGEPGVPPVAPAVANAIYAATGRRVRTLPIERALAP